MDGNSKSRFTSNWSPVPGKGTAQRQKSCDPAQRWGTDRAVESAHGTSSVGGVYPNNRLSEYTPWPEPAIRPGTPDFGGQLGQYHRELNNEILPALIDEYALDTEKLAYGGYSLGGLAAVMSLWETEVFASVFSLCGSFWYPGVADFIEEHPLLNRSARVYLQNGTREGKGHNNRLSELLPMLSASTLHCGQSAELKPCSMIMAIMTGRTNVFVLFFAGSSRYYKVLFGVNLAYSRLQGF